MHPELESVLLFVAKKLNDLNISWSLYGSYSQYLQGVETTPRDIDISVHHSDLQRVRILFDEYDQTDFTTYPNNEAQEFKVFIDDVEVQFCGDYPYGIYAKKLLNRRNILERDIRGVTVYLLRLEPELECYVHVKQKPEKIERLRNFLSKEDKNIEVEIRSFITKEKYDELIVFFNRNAELKKRDYQETFYFDSDCDLRIQKNHYYSKIWMKKGKIHDEHREEIEIKSDKKSFNDLEKLFRALGYNVEIKWFRDRNEYLWEGITVCLDYTLGYGYIIELEMMDSEENKESTYNLLKEKLESLGVEITPREVFDEKYQHYKENWKSLTEE